MMKNVSVVFVCLGNICRSPTAEGVFRQLVSKRGLSEYFQIDSSGTSDWHVGEAPDSRATQAAQTRGIDLSQLKARQATARDFAEFDYVIAMDDENYANLSRLATPAQQDKLHLLLDFANNVTETEVPDPYFGGGFPHVFELIENASEGLLNHIIAEHV
ncbi:MAG: low molecular weight protein-tyrosine-phosphatase [Arenicellales bacterium]